jgi:hypothetical protein
VLYDIRRTKNPAMHGRNVCVREWDFGALPP